MSMNKQYSAEGGTDSSCAVMAYLFDIRGPISNEGLPATSVLKAHWPHATWKSCNEGRRFGLAWSNDLGPSAMASADIANDPDAFGMNKVLAFRR